jgi:predicted nucleic acid-binding Zn ribbon protein
MCKKCKGQLKLISYKWNDEEIIYKYRCEECGYIELKVNEREEDTLKDMIDNSNLYKKFNL